MTTLTTSLANFIPDKLRVKLKWHWESTQSVGTGPWVAEFSGNSPWDPDTTGIGSTANMWTTFKNMYSDYTCLTSSILVHASLEPDDANITSCRNFWFSIQPGLAGQTIPTSLDYFYAQNKSRVKFKDVVWYPNESKKPTWKLQMLYSTKNVFGEVIPYTDTNIATSSDPIREWVYTVCIQNPDAGESGSVGVTLSVWTHYWVTFEKPKLITDF